MPRFQHVPSSFNATDELDPNHDPPYSDAEFLPDFQDYMPSFSHGQGTTMSNQHTSTIRVAPLRRARARSSTPISRPRSRDPSEARRSLSPERQIVYKADSILAGELVTHRAGPPFHATTYAINVSRPMAGSSRSATHSDTPDQAASDLELYADSDGEFEEFISSLSLAIETDVDEMDKWELPPRSSANHFSGNGWKLTLVVSYTAVGPEPQPSIIFKGLAVDCSLVPRNIPANARKLRKPSVTFKISHRGATVTVNEEVIYNRWTPTRASTKIAFGAGQIERETAWNMLQTSTFPSPSGFFPLRKPALLRFRRELGYR